MTIGSLRDEFYPPSSWRGIVLGAGLVLLAGCSQPAPVTPSSRPVVPTESIPVKSTSSGEVAPGAVSGSLSSEFEVDTSGWFETPEALLEVVLDGIEEKDYAKLRSVKLSEDVFREVWYRHSRRDKSVRPEDVPMDPRKVGLIWSLSEAGSEKAMRILVNSIGGRQLELLKVEPEGVRDFDRFLVWDKVELTCFDVALGREVQIGIGSLMELDGRYRLFAYDD